MKLRVRSYQLVVAIGGGGVASTSHPRHAEARVAVGLMDAAWKRAVYYARAMRLGSCWLDRAPRSTLVRTDDSTFVVIPPGTVAATPTVGRVIRPR